RNTSRLPCSAIRAATTAPSRARSEPRSKKCTPTSTPTLGSSCSPARTCKDGQAMALKPTVTLPSDWIAASNQYGNTVVATYANGGNPASRKVSSHGAEANPQLQAHARMAECAFAIFLGLDPGRVLDWSPRSDGGWDL